MAEVQAPVQAGNNPMSRKHQKILEDNRGLIAQHLKVCSIVNRMTDLIDQFDRQLIMCKGSDEERAYMFLDMLPKFGERAYSCFVMTLMKIKGQDWLGNYLANLGAVQDDELDNALLKSATRHAVRDRHTRTSYKDVRWNKISKTHRPKLGALVEKLKTGDSGCKQIGSTRVCFEKEFEIGKGSLETQVYVGLADNGREVAVKRVPSDLYKTMGETERSFFTKKSVEKEKHIITCWDSVEIDGYGYFVLDLCEQTLEDYVKLQDEIKEQGPRIVEEILLGLKALHCRAKETILHRDLKPSNVLLDITGRALLADFGLCRSLLKSQEKHESVERGTIGWMASETISTGADDKVEYTPASDMQVAGMLAYYVLTCGHHPYGASPTGQNWNIMNGTLVDFDKNLKDEVARDLIKWMLEHDPKNRPNVKQCLKHPYFWSKETRFKLLTEVGKQQEFRDNDTSCNVVKDLHKSLPELKPPKPHWKRRIDPDVFNHLSRKRKYPAGITGLLRFIRNTDIHWRDDPPPPTIKSIVNQPQEYFLQLFPRLPFLVYKVIRDHWKSRDELKAFF